MNISSTFKNYAYGISSRAGAAAKKVRDAVSEKIAAVKDTVFMGVVRAGAATAVPLMGRFQKTDDYIKQINDEDGYSNPKEVFCFVTNFAEAVSKKLVAEGVSFDFGKSNLKDLIESILFGFFANEVNFHPSGGKLEFSSVFQKLQTEVFSLISAEFRKLKQEGIYRVKPENFLGLTKKLIDRFVPETISGRNVILPIITPIISKFAGEYLAAFYNGTIGRGTRSEKKVLLEAFQQDKTKLDEFKKLSSIMAESLRKKVLEVYAFTSNDDAEAKEKKIDVILNLLSTQINKTYPFDDKNLRPFIEALLINLQKGNESKSASQAEVLSWIDLAIKKSILSVSKNLILALPEEKRKDQNNLLNHVAQHFLETVQKHLPSPTTDLNKAIESSKPLTKAVTSLLFKSLNEELPLPEEMKIIAKEQILKQFNEKSGELLVAITNWKNGKKEDEKGLKGLFQSDDASHFIEKLKENTVPAISFFARFDEGEKRLTQVLEYLPQISDPFKEQIRGVIKSVGDSYKGGPYLVVLDHVKDLLEPLYYKVFHQVARSIHKMENVNRVDGTSLLEYLTKESMVEFKAHINRLIPAKKNVSKVPKSVKKLKVAEEMKQAGTIHEATMPLIAPGSATANEVKKSDEFFEKVSKKILHIVGLDSKILDPLTPSLKNLAFEKVEKVIMPLILKQGILIGGATGTLQQLLLSLSLKGQAKGASPDLNSQKTVLPKTQFTIDLESELQDTIQSFIGLQKNFLSVFIGVLLMVPYLRQTIGEVIGQIVMKQLKNGSSPIPTLEKVKEICKVSVDKMNEAGFTTYLFPKTDDEKKASEAKKVADQIFLDKNLPQSLNDLINSILSPNLQEKTALFRKGWEDFFKLILGDKTVAKVIREGLMWLLDNTLFFVIKGFTWLIDFMIRSIVTIVLGNSTERRLEDIGLPHEDLFIRVLAKLLEEKKSHETPRRGAPLPLDPNREELLLPNG